MRALSGMPIVYGFVAIFALVSSIAMTITRIMDEMNTRDDKQVKKIDQPKHDPASQKVYEID